MMNLMNLTYVVYTVSFLFFLIRRSKLMMHFFQQEEYYGGRFIKYISGKLRFIDKRLSIAIFLLFAATSITKDLYIHLFILSALFCISAFMHHDPCKKAKKVLVITTRVKRIYTVFYLIFVLIFAVHILTLNLSSFYFLNILLIQLIPFVIVLSNVLLKPTEKRVCNKYLQEAKDKMAELKPIVIGITGSYGKTSTKHILAHIMSSFVPTIATPGSVNTEMGITRVIREKLLPRHKYFIVEMGAYCRGSIANRCELAPPTYGMVTSIGDAHYERFKSIDNVAKTKFELADAVFKNGKGDMIINSDAIDKKFVREYEKKGKGKFLKLSGLKKDDFTVSKEKETKDGIEFTITIKKRSCKVKAPVYGKHQISNVAMCFAMAYKIGISPDSIVAALKSCPQISHRLEVKRNLASATLIDDAYNSNPIGFKSALKTLKVLKQKGGRTILVTPGMVELGDLHDVKHHELGREAGKIADYVLAIIPDRIQSFIEGFYETASSSKKLLGFNTFKEARKWLDKNTTPKDVVLYENDLPDLYENRIKI